MKKLLISFMLVVFLLFSSLVVYANEGESILNSTNEKEVFIPVSEEVQAEKERLFLESIMAQESSTTKINYNIDGFSLPIMRDIPQYEYKHVVVDRQEFRRQKIGYAANQPVNGTTFSEEGAFHWQDGGPKVNLSFSFGYGPVSIGVSKGTQESTGYEIKCPYINTYCKLYIKKDIKVTVYEIYKRPMMAPNQPWELVDTVQNPTVTGHHLIVDPAPFTY